MTALLKALFVAAALSGVASLSFAQDAPKTRLLKVSPDLCPATVSVMKQWASTAPEKGFGAFAIPTDRDAKAGQCGVAKTTLGATAIGYDTPGLARAAALAACEEGRAEGFGKCYVFGTLFFEEN